VLPQLLVAVAELSSEACWSIVAIHPEGRVVLCRSEIYDGGVEVSNMCHIGPTYTMAASVILAEYARYKVVPLGEMEANSSDPKHVGQPMGPSDGLGVLGLTDTGVVEPA
jgi:hypothetical protein